MLCVSWLRSFRQNLVSVFVQLCAQVFIWSVSLAHAGWEPNIVLPGVWKSARFWCVIFSSPRGINLNLKSPGTRVALLSPSNLIFLMLWKPRNSASCCDNRETQHLSIYIYANAFSLCYTVITQTLSAALTDILLIILTLCRENLETRHSSLC